MPLTTPVRTLMLFAILWQACATPISPGGGPKDTRPPQLDTAQSTRNKQVFFSDRQILMTFDEWIQLDKVYDQLVVSPPLEFRPEVKAHGKELVFRFDEREVLRDSVTYTINFGNSVKDQTEGNKAGDLRFVFSTGPVLDSLSYSGKLLDAYTSDPVGELPVLLFAPSDDSVFVRDKPLYYTTTGKDGRFRFENLKAGRFRIMAIRDQNSNLNFDIPGEAIAFADRDVIIPDTSASRPVLRLSTPDYPAPVTGMLHLDSMNLNIGFASPPGMALKLPGIPDSLLYQYPDRDSIRFWLSEPGLWPDSVILAQGEQHADTLKLPAPKTERQEFKLRTRTGKATQAPQREIDLIFNQPIQGFDPGMIMVLDTGGQEVLILVSRDSSDKRHLAIRGSLREELDYRILCLPGAISAWDGQPIPDTLTAQVKTGKRADFGKLHIRLNAMEPGELYWIEILFKENQVVHATAMTGTETEQDIELDGYDPGNYFIRIIKDRNGNQKWDPGNMWKGIQPEPVHRLSLGELRANWELKLNVEVPADH